MKITRRTALIGAAAGSALPLLTAGPAGAAVPVEGASLKVVAASARQWPDSPFATLMSMQVPLELELVWPAKLGSRVNIELLVDGRLLDVGSRFVIQDQAGIKSTASLETKRSGDRVKGRGQVLLPSDDQRFRLSLPVNRVSAYPADNFDRAISLTVTVTSTTGSGARVTTTAPAVAGGSIRAWGAEAYMSLESIDVRDHDGSRARYRSPISAQVLSIGPTATPVGILAIAVDAELVEGLSVTGVRVAGADIEVDQATTVSDGTRTISIHTPEIPAGAWCEVGLAARLTTGIRVRSVKYATLTYLADTDGRLYQRETGRYCVVDLTPSGEPLFDDIAAGVI